eukprot:scaffold2934_cov176-Amphora_coffeaeformis.AAC.10
MPLVDSICQQCQTCPSPSGDPGELRTLSATVARCRTEASSEGETSEYDEDDDDDETTIEDHHSKSEDHSEDWSSSGAFDEEGRVSAQSDDVTRLPERVSQGKACPNVAEASPSSHSIMNIKPSLNSNSLLPSLLRRNTKKRRGVSRRRVRGLWGSHEQDPFALLHDDLLQRALSYLSLADTCTLSMVSKRWNYMATREATFQTVDATDFVERAFSNFSTKSPPAKAARETAQALSDVLENHIPRSLTICNIGEKICPDTYLPSLKGLQHLKLDNFTNLTDTHIHVWMLSSTAGGQGRPRDIHLRKLELENCPKLSNGAVKTIAHHCPALQGLSLAGNKRVEDLSELSVLWRVEAQQTLQMQRSSSNLARMSTNSLRSLDGTSLFPGLPATDGSTPAPQLRPKWDGKTSKKIGSPKLGLTSPKQLLMEGNMSSVFDPPATTKSESFFAPPKQPKSSSSQQAGSGSAESVASFFLPPVKSAPSEKSSDSLSGLSAPPALAPKTSSSSMSGLFLPPKAKLLPPASKPESSLSGLFAPTANAASSSVTPTQAKDPPSALFTRPDNKPATALASMFKPPTTNSSSQTLPSRLFVPPAANQQKKRSHNGLFGLFAPPVESAPPQPTNGLFAPPTTPEPSPAQVKDTHTIHDRSERNGLFTPPLKEQSNTPTNTPSGLFVPPMNPNLEPPLSPSKNPGAGLESLFRPPGSSPNTSPQAANNRPTIHRRCSSQSMPVPGRLDRINISGTGVKPKAILTSLQQASGRVLLITLECKATGQVWSEDEVRELTEVVSFAKLRLLDLEYEGPVVADVMSRHPPSGDLQGCD